MGQVSYAEGMKIRLVSASAVVAFAFCLSAAPALRAQAPAGDDRAAVRAVVDNYLHGLKFNDVESLKKAFWPDAKLFFTMPDGSLGQLTQTQWYAGFAQAAGKESKADLKVASLDVTNDVAAVKVVETYPSSRFTDYISLVRISGQWQIVNKIYTEQKAAK
jgi:hypothetical protein